MIQIMVLAIAMLLKFANKAKVVSIIVAPRFSLSYNSLASEWSLDLFNEIYTIIATEIIALSHHEEDHLFQAS